MSRGDTVRMSGALRGLHRAFIKKKNVTLFSLGFSAVKNAGVLFSCVVCVFFFATGESISRILCAVGEIEWRL